jgi:hypothetical protein
MFSLVELFDHTKYYVAGSYAPPSSPSAVGEWEEIFIVSLNSKGEIQGQVRYSCSVPARQVTSVSMLSFEPVLDNFESMEWTRDILRSIDLVFNKFRVFDKICFTCLGDNPVKKSYRKLATLAGQVLYARPADVRIRTGEIVDAEYYEIYRDRWNEVKTKRFSF